MTDAPAHVPDPGVGAWVSERLRPSFDRVTVDAVVPAGFEAYARILHPATEWDATTVTPRQVTWAEVAGAHGRTVHPLAQWCHLFDSREGRVRGPQVPDGSLPEAELEALVRLLGPGTPAFYGVWDGFGWVHGGSASVTFGWGADGEPFSHEDAPAFPPEVLAAPRLHTYGDAERRCPVRSYLLFRGPLAACGWDEWEHDGVGHWRQPPNLIWPEDRSWCVATEIDFPFTLVGGSRALVDAIVAEPGFEAFEVPADADMSCGGDTLNPGPPYC